MNCTSEHVFLEIAGITKHGRFLIVLQSMYVFLEIAGITKHGRFLSVICLILIGAHHCNTLN